MNIGKRGMVYDINKKISQGHRHIKHVHSD